MPIRRQAIIWTNADPIHWRTYAEVGGDELITFNLNSITFNLNFPPILVFAWQHLVWSYYICTVVVLEVDITMNSIAMSKQPLMAKKIFFRKSDFMICDNDNDNDNDNEYVFIAM